MTFIVIHIILTFRKEEEQHQQESIQEHVQGAMGFDAKDTPAAKQDPLSKELGVKVSRKKCNFFFLSTRFSLF